MASNTIIQCTSSSSHTTRTYDVFVSFRGKDTRNNFTGFLFEALRRKGIDAFKDDADLKKGESIAPELLQAIEDSRIFVVVFSIKYASSTWCLRELAHICNSIQTSPRQVLPIFYDVDPSEVRKQSGSYEIAFVKHEERFREDKEKMEEVLRWRQALTQVANLSGWDIRNKPQYAEIEQIVQNIINILGPKFSSLPNDHLVGIESRVEKLTKLLHLGSLNDVLVVGISGMGGIGKTTLSRALYERISHQYEFHCFIDDVSKIYRHSSILGVQKELLSQSPNEKNLEICNVSEGTCLVWTRLYNARALIVLDNVDQVEQLKMFAGNRETMLRECLGGGSRIIIISRDEHILRTHGVDDVYQVQPLNQEDAVKLFCKNAFKGNSIVNDYEKLTSEVLSHAQGHPLAIEVMGRSLFGRNVSQWTSALATLRDNKSRKIMDVLRISFDELDDIDKEIFLDIACLFNFSEEQRLKEILNFRGFHPEYGLQVLLDKSLITIKGGMICMHDLLIDLGKCIVKEISPKEPRKWSRLWDYKDLHKVMSDNKPAKNLEVIAFESRLAKFCKTTMRVDALSKMSHLKILILDGPNYSGSLNYLSNELGYLDWTRYPFECLPPYFQPHKLVELILVESNIKQLWEDTKPLHNLRRLDLSHSKNLIETPNFGEALNLQYLRLERCIQLKQINPSMDLLSKLTVLNLKDCTSLIELPHFGEAIYLETLNLEGCIQLRQIDPSIGLLSKLTILNLKDCKSLIKLPHFGEALHLETLNLEGCIQLRQIDPSIGLLTKLTFFNLKNCKNLVSLPNSIFGLNSLEYLSLSGCSKLYIIQLLEEPRDVRHLKKLCIGEAPGHSQSISTFIKRWVRWPSHLLHARARKDSISCLLPSFAIFSCMRELDLSFCNLLQIPDAFGNMHCLERLNLSGNNFSTLPNFKELSKLIHLNIQHCKRLKNLPELPSRTDLPSQSYMRPETIKELEFENVENGLGLNIFNCPEFFKRKCCTSMSFSWMMQIVRIRTLLPYIICTYESESRILWPPSISSIIPGSETPRWFNNQHEGMGSFINIDISHSVQLDNNWIGIACCAIFVVRNERGIGPPETEQHHILPIPLLFCGDLVTNELDHMWLFYFTRPHFIDMISRSRTNLGDLKLEFEIWNCRHLHVEVKKYGHRLVYEQELQHRKNSVPRKRKFLAIEENKCSNCISAKLPSE